MCLPRGLSGPPATFLTLGAPRCSRGARSVVARVMSRWRRVLSVQQRETLTRYLRGWKWEALWQRDWRPQVLTFDGTTW